MLLIKEGEVSKGYRMLQNANELSPTDPAIQLHLGQAMIQQKQYTQAQQVLSALIKSAPESPQASEAKTLLESMPTQ